MAAKRSQLVGLFAALLSSALVLELVRGEPAADEATEVWTATLASVDAQPATAPPPAAAHSTGAPTAVPAASPVPSGAPAATSGAPPLGRLATGDQMGAISSVLMAATNEQLRVLQNSSARAEPVPVADLLPKQASLFRKDAIDVKALDEIDCHLRNLDYCFAGLLGSAQQHFLPETDEEFEMRCDELKATRACLAVYNERCQTVKVFALLAPTVSNGELLERAQLAANVSADQLVLPELAQELLQLDKQQLKSLKLANVADLCEADKRNSRESQLVRPRILRLAKCVNARVPQLRPCLEDLKTAVQLFYEPRRTLPLRPTCCALSRFRACSMAALDQVCGLSSFEQLLSQSGLAMGAGQASPVAMLAAVERVCRQASDHRSAYCANVLPPRGLRGPQRRGQRASKLAKALDLISFAPGAQDGASF